MPHNCLHLEASEIKYITRQQPHIHLEEIYCDDVECEFKLVHMGRNGEYSFPAIAVYEPGTDDVKTLIQLEGDKIFVLKPVEVDEDEPLGEPASQYSISDGLPVGVQ